MALTTLSQKIAVELERRILAGELAANEQLPPVNELSEMLGVSRSVVRDAVQALVARSLLTTRQGSGTVVAEPTDALVGEALIALLMRSGATVGDLMAARASLETQLAPLAMRNGTSAHWDKMEKELANLRSAVNAGRWQEAQRAHTEFHLGLIRACALPALDLMLKPMEEVITLSTLPIERGQQSHWHVESHEPVLAALRAGNEEELKSVMEQHFSYVDSEENRDFRATSLSRAADIGSYRDFAVAGAVVTRSDNGQ